MASGRDYLTDGSIDWGDVAATMVGAVVTVMAYSVARAIGLVSAGLDRAIAGLEWFAVRVISTPFEGGLEVISTAWSSFIEFLPSLGPFAFPVAVIATTLSFAFLFWGVSRIVWSV